MVCLRRTNSSSLMKNGVGRDELQGDKTFVDTNALLSTHDLDAKLKHEIVNRVLREMWASEAAFSAPKYFNWLKRKAMT